MIEQLLDHVLSTLLEPGLLDDDNYCETRTTAHPVLMSDAAAAAGSSSGSTTPRPPSATKLARNATPAEQQAAALQRLLAKPDREIKIPERKEGVTKTLRAPREMMKNVQGSSAGAGSGEFVSLFSIGALYPGLKPAAELERDPSRMYTLTDPTSLPPHSTSTSKVDDASTSGSKSWTRKRNTCV